MKFSRGDIIARGDKKDGDGIYYVFDHYTQSDDIFDVDGIPHTESAGYIVPYTGEKYIYVRAVVLYDGIYWLVPSTVSALGTISINTLMKLILKTPGKRWYPKILDRKICENLCPGWLDEGSGNSVPDYFESFSQKPLGDGWTVANGKNRRKRHPSWY